MFSRNEIRDAILRAHRDHHDATSPLTPHGEQLIDAMTDEVMDVIDGWLSHMILVKEFGGPHGLSELRAAARAAVSVVERKQRAAADGQGASEN